MSDACTLQEVGYSIDSVLKTVATPAPQSLSAAGPAEFVPLQPVLPVASPRGNTSTAPQDSTPAASPRSTADPTSNARAGNAGVGTDRDSGNTGLSAGGSSSDSVPPATDSTPSNDTDTAVPDPEEITDPGVAEAPSGSGDLSTGKKWGISAGAVVAFTIALVFVCVKKFGVARSAHGPARTAHQGSVQGHVHDIHASVGAQGSCPVVLNCLCTRT